MMKFVVTLCFLLLLVAPCGPASAQTELLDKVVAAVNDYAITQVQLQQMVDIFDEFQGGASPFSDETERRRMVLFKSIDDYLLGEAVKNEGVFVSDTEIQTALDSLRGNLSPEQFEQKLKQKHVSPAQLRARLTQQLIGEKAILWKVGEIRETAAVKEVASTQVTEYLEQLQAILAGQEPADNGLPAFIVQHKQAIDEQARVHLGQIVLQGADQATLVASYLSENIDFTELAREYSIGPGAAEGGDLGWISLLDLPPALREAVANLEDSDVTAPIQINDELYQIIQVKARTDLSLDEWQEPVRAYLQNQQLLRALDAWILGLRKNAYIIISDEHLKI